MVRNRVLLLMLLCVLALGVPAAAFAQSLTVYVKIPQPTAPAADTQINVFVYDTANPAVPIGTGSYYFGNAVPPATGYAVAVTGISSSNFVASKSYYAVAEVGRLAAMPNNRIFKGQSANFNNSTTIVEVSTRPDRGNMTPVGAGEWALAIGLTLAVIAASLLLWRNRRMRAPLGQPA